MGHTIAWEKFNHTHANGSSRYTELATRQPVPQMFTQAQFMEIAKGARKEKLIEIRKRAYANILEQGRTEISRAQIKVTFHEPYVLVPTSIEDIQNWLHGAKFTITIDAKKSTTSSDEIRHAAADM